MDLIPDFGNDTPQSLLSSFKTAYQCMGGDKSLAQYDEHGHCVAYCYCGGGRTLMVWILFTGGYMVQSFGSMGVVKYGNATLSQIMSAVVTPIQAVAFCIGAIMAPFPSQTLTWQVIVSLVTIVLGMIGYTYADNRVRSKSLLFVN